ncbi:MAG: DNA polymerase/3'-5' exonuclease PolX [Chloroflexi bacterium]|nr:DNA polymerase/3'-5' exonuclease PolX [Chloroflexota bacterium]
MVSMTNKQIAAVLDEIADLLQLKGDVFRERAYREASRRLDMLSQQAAELYAAGKLHSIPGIGKSMEGHIAELLETGRSQRYEELKKEFPTGLLELLQVPGLGPKRARKLYEELDITNLAELERAAKEHRLHSVPGMGEKTEANILRALERRLTRGRRLLLGVALPAAEQVAGLLRGHPAVAAAEPAGSIRRRLETIGDIDILVASTQPKAVMEAIIHLPIVKEVLAAGPTKTSVLNPDDLQIDVRVIDPSTYGAALQYFTGSKQHNIHLRDIAIRKGYKVSEYGIFKEPGDHRVGGEKEEDIYRVLGMDIMPPEIREDTGELEAALEHRLPTLVELSDIQGDLHCHTDWSDGVDPLETMASAARALGYRYLAITDHSRGLGVAHGLSIERLREQRHLIDEFNERSPDLHVLFGTEVNIKSDGNLDYEDEVMAQFDIVTASVHGGFNQDRDTITKRILRAVRSPYVDIIGHPTGRLINARDPYDVDLEAVMRECAKCEVAMEINSSPERLDLNDVHCRQAKELGVMVAINADAHVAAHLNFMRYGVYTARRGWLEKKNVLNTLPFDELRARLRTRRQKRG